MDRKLKNKKEKGLNEFWQWMEGKNYAEYMDGEIYFKIWDPDGGDYYIEPKKQMLLGYMWQYMKENDIMVKSSEGVVSIIQTTDEMYQDAVDAIVKKEIK